MFMLRNMIVATVFAVTAAGASAADEKMSIKVSRLTMESALTIARGAIEACRQKGISISVAVVDRGGVIQVLLRDTVAPPISLRISRQKAYTAANFQAATGDLAELSNGPIGRVDGLIMSAGGLPIEAAGSLFGAVGVSGAPSGETDAACAQAGIDAVRDDLEMSME